MLRFTSESSSLPDQRHAEQLRKPPSRYAAGGQKTPIMLANVVVSQQHPTVLYSLHGKQAIWFYIEVQKCIASNMSSGRMKWAIDSAHNSAGGISAVQRTKSSF